MRISYAQNFEDVILWRALAGVHEGFYIDIGAQDPVVDSVSLSFYKEGWRGVHVEPAREYAEKLRRDRPEEQVVEAAVGGGAAELTFYYIPETGLSTGDLRIVEMHRRDNRTLIEQKVEMIPLASILDRFGAGKDVHWLKIDVEGMEKSVVESWPPSQVRPWIVVVESTLPNSQVPSFLEWEPQLVALGYAFVYFDGLNRFYLSEAHRELSQAFGPGPNWFDRFRLSESSVFVGASKEGLVRDLKEKLARAEARNAELTEAHAAAAAAHRAAQNQVAELEAANASAKAAYFSAERRIAELETLPAAPRRVREEIARLRENESSIRASFELARGQLEEVTAARMTLQAERLELHANIASLEARLNSLQEENTGLQSALARANSSLGDLETSLGALRAESKLLADSLAEATADHARSRSELESARARAVELLAMHASATQAHDTAQSHIAELREAHAAATKMYLSALERIAHLEAIEETSQTLRAELNALRESERSLRASFDLARHKMDEMGEANLTLQSERLTLQASIASLGAEHAAARAGADQRIAELEAANEVLRAGAADADERARQLELQAVEANPRLAAIEARVSELHAALMASLAAAQVANSAMAEIQGRHDAAQAEHVATVDRLNEEMRDVALRLQTVHAEKTELDAMRSRIAADNERLQELAARNEEESRKWWAMADYLTRVRQIERDADGRKMEQLERQAELATEELNRVLGSRSWRATRPFRLLSPRAAFSGLRKLRANRKQAPLALSAPTPEPAAPSVMPETPPALSRRATSIRMGIERAVEFRGRGA